MTITPEMINLALMYLKSNGAQINKIKVTQNFADYLIKECHPTFLNKDPLPPGVFGEFVGVPIEIDNTIENEYYELVY